MVTDSSEVKSSCWSLSLTSSRLLAMWRWLCMTRPSFPLTPATPTRGGRQWGGIRDPRRAWLIAGSCLDNGRHGESCCSVMWGVIGPRVAFVGDLGWSGYSGQSTVFGGGLWADWLMMLFLACWWMGRCGHYKCAGAYIVTLRSNSHRALNSGSSCNGKVRNLQHLFSNIYRIEE